MPALAKTFRRASCLEWALIAVILLYPLLTIFQGLDVTDFGLLSVMYRDALTLSPDPTSPDQVGVVIPLASNYLTEVLGGFWHMLFGGLGAFAFKLLFALLAWATAWLVYVSLRPFIARRALLIGLALAVLAITPEMQWVSYNNFPALLYVCTAFFLLRMFRSARARDFFFAGFFMGLTIFSRLTGIAGLLLFLIPLAFIYSRLGNRAMLRMCALSFFGFAAACILVSGLIVFLGHEEVLIAGIQSIFGQGHNDTHSFPQLLKRFFADSGKVAGTVLALFAFYALFSRFVPKTRETRGWRQGGARACFARILPAICAFFCVHLPMYVFEVTILGKTIITFSLYILAVAIFFAGIALASLPGPFFRNRWTYIYAIAFGIAFLVPQGSDRGLWNSVYGLWLAIPLVFGSVFRAKSGDFYCARFNIRFNPQVLFWAALVPAWVFTVAFALTFVYRDHANRLELVHSLHHPALRFIHTNKERADLMNELTGYLARFDLKGKPVLAAPSAPLLYYVTGSQPYIGVSAPIDLTNAFAWARQNYKERPLIILNRADTRSREWPLPSPWKVVASRRDKWRSVLNALTSELIQEGGYSEVWTNTGFAVYEPPND